MGRLFGTDGVRGIANRELTPELAFHLGEAAAYVLRKHTDGKGFFVVGKDTRISGDLLECALIAGICSQGVDVWRLGVLPTPAVAYLTRSLGATAGVVISASHNPFADNGIKFFSKEGFKLFDAIEDEIEEVILSEKKLSRPVGEGVGRVKEAFEAKEQYINYVVSTVDCRFDGIKLVLDCANGAAAAVAPQIWRRLGAEVVAINTDYDGTNINVNCGSTHPAEMCKAVVEHNASFGIAHDGDADRVIMADEKGNEVDGDQIMFVCALALKEEGKLPGNTVVATVMSNLGLDLALKKEGINLEKTKVGDRYVLERMLEKGYDLGGEQSGHIIFRHLNTTGDGIITSLQAARVIAEKKAPLSELAGGMQRVPQELVNVRVKDKSGLTNNEAVKKAIEAAEAELGESGRILVRPSGTEPLVRVMVEAVDAQKLKRILRELTAVVEKELG